MKNLKFTKTNGRTTVDYTSVKNDDPKIKWNRKIQHFTVIIHKTGEIYQLNAHYEHHYDYNDIVLLDAVSLVKFLKKDEDHFYCFSLGTQILTPLFKEHNPFI